MRFALLLLAMFVLLELLDRPPQPVALIDAPFHPAEVDECGRPRSPLLDAPEGRYSHKVGAPYRDGGIA
jgi:hypothetical protein